MLAWAKSLKPGDKVVYLRRGNLYFLQVEKITPAGWVKTTNRMTFAQAGWGNNLYERGGYGEIVPVTDGLAQQIHQNRTIEKAKKILEKEFEDSREMTYERAVKIIEAFESM